MSTITIGSFNIQDCSDGEGKKDWDLISKIVRDEKFDLVALQEILSDGAVQRIASLLGTGWNCWHERPPSATLSLSKGYAFLWNGQRVSAVRPPSVSEFGLALTRPPATGVFAYQTKHILLVNTQISAVGYRTMAKENEYRILCDVVLSREDRRERQAYLPTYSILLGDYNMLPHWCDEILDDFHRNGNTDLHPQVGVREKTTIKKDGGYALSLDHFTFDQRLWECMPICDRVDAPANHVGTTDVCFERYRQTVSDHVPIKMTVDL